MKRTARALGVIGAFFVLGFLFPRAYLALWAAGFAIAVTMAWPELMAGYSRRADRTLRIGKKKGPKG